MTDIKKLEELGKAATPGPWIATPDGPLWVKREGDEYGRGWRANRANDAAYVAAANPAALLSLISQYRRMEEALRFYADERRYNGANRRPIPDDPYSPPDRAYIHDVTKDGGCIARAALQDQDQ